MKVRQQKLQLVAFAFLLMGPTVSAQETPSTTTAVAFSPDGSALALAQPGRPGKIQVLDRQEGKINYTLASFGDTTKIRFSPDGSWLAFSEIYSPGNGVNANEVTLSNRLTGQMVKKYPQAQAFDFSPDRQHLALLFSGGLLLHHLASNQAKAWIELPTPAWQIAYHPQSTHLALIAKIFKRQRQEFVLQLLDLRSRQIVKESVPLGDVFYHLAFSPDGKTLVSGHATGLVRFWNSLDLKEQASISTGLKGQVQPVFSRDGKHLLLGSTMSRSALLLDTKTRQTKMKIRFGDCAFPLLTSRFTAEVITPEQYPEQFALAVTSGSGATTQDWVLSGCDQGTLFDVQNDERRALF